METHSSVLVAVAPLVLWDFLRRSANLQRLADPDLAMTLVEAPEFLHPDATLTWKIRRFGISQRIVLQVIHWQENQGWVEEQREGPWKSWTHQRHLEAVGDGTLLEEKIALEMPGGILGSFLSAEKVSQELERMFRFRDEFLAGAFHRK